MTATTHPTPPANPERCTAHAALMARAAGSLEPDASVRCPDHFAGAFLRHALGWSPATVEEARRVRDYREACVPGIYYFHTARTRYVDRAVSQRLAEPHPPGVAQFVVLGAGFDSRALRFHHALADRPVFEVDRPETQRSKAEAVRHMLGREPDGLAFVPADFAEPDLPLTLARAGYDEARPTLFLFEGVSYYLDPPSLWSVLRLAGRAAPGSSIVFDFLDAGVLRGELGAYGYGTAEHVAYVEAIGEPFRCGLDAEPARLAALLRQLGLELTDLAGPAALERHELTRPDGRLLGRVVSHIYLAQASPRSVLG